MTGQQVVVRHAYGITVAGLVLGIVVTAGFLLLIALPDLVGGMAFVAPSPTPSPSAEPSPTPRSAMALAPIGIEMAPDSDCAACHLTQTGVVGTKAIPDLAHPLWGWRECTACHANDSLVKTAPGHSGMHKDDCLVCHQAPPTTGLPTHAPLRPEHMGGQQPCTSCHGLDEHAPLPEAMKGRENCWVCHNGPEFTYLFASTEPSVAPAQPSPAASATP
jgi:hypothetical protein